MAKKEKKIETNPAKFYTNERLMFAVGLLKKDTWSGTLVFILTEITMSLAFVHYAAKIILGEENDILDIMKSLHLSVTYIVAWMSGISMLSMTKYYYKSTMILHAGFHTYEDPLPAKYHLRRALVNERMRKVGRNVLYTTGFLVFASIVKEPSPTDFKRWRKLYAGWFPFKVDNYTTYAISQAFHILFAVNIVCWSSAFMITFITFAEHTLCEIKIIGDYIRESFDVYKNAQTDIESEKILLKRIEDIVKHHNAILRFFSHYQTYYYIHLLTIMLGTTFMLCTSTSVIAAPESTAKDVIGFFAMLLPEFFVSWSYCYYGQLITNYSEELRDCIYSTEWYNQTKKVKFAVFFMLMRTRKPLKLKAGGLTDASLPSFKEMVHTSFTYFNMIQAMK